MSVPSRKMTSQPAWVQKPKLLADAIYAIFLKLKLIEDPAVIQVLFSKEAMEKYWMKCFTHKSVSADYNNDAFEFYGDSVLGYNFAKYLRRRFKDGLNQANGTLLQNQYMSKKFQAQLARELGLVELLRFDPESEQSIHIQEDTFEAFAGCIDNIVDDLVGEGAGALYVYNLIIALFDPIPIVLGEVKKDDKTLLKEIYEKMGWGEPNYVTKNSDQPRLGPFRTEIRNLAGTIIGFGYGSEKDAPFIAAAEALKYLEKQGITWESADQQKTERNRQRAPEFDRQYRRVEAAMAILANQARSQGKVPPTEFKIAKVEERKAEGGFRYTFAIQAGYQIGPTTHWRSLLQQTGSNSDQTKINVMKEFADMYQIPAQLPPTEV